MRWFLLILLISANAFASSWSDIEAGYNFKLNQSFQLKSLDRSGALLDYSKGDSFYLKEIMPLHIPGFPMLLYIFEADKCPGKDVKTDSAVIKVNASSDLVKVSVEQDLYCELKIYLEAKYYYNESLFE